MEDFRRCNNNSDHRTIRQFPLSYNSEASPHRQFTFEGVVREYCDLEVSKGHLRVAKCIFVGDIAVGKTCLINRFGYNAFTNNYKATIGVDFDVQKFNILDMPFNLQIWDTAGQERFKCIASTYYRGCHVAVITFDMSNVSTLSSCVKWLQDVMSSNMSPTFKPLIFLVGTKKELLCESAFKFVEKEGMKVAGELNAEFWAVSSATGENVPEFFCRLAALTFQEMIFREIDSNNRNSLKPIKYSDKFIKLRRDKSCKKFFSFSCSRF